MEKGINRVKMPDFSSFPFISVPISENKTEDDERIPFSLLLFPHCLVTQEDEERRRRMKR